MEKYRIQLINIGRAKVNEIFMVEAVDLPDAEWFAYKECKNHLISNNIELKQKKDKYNVYAGFRKVGEVKITKEE